LQHPVTKIVQDGITIAGLIATPFIIIVSDQSFEANHERFE